ncbi:MAG: FAD-binding protein [Spirochaetales bacterium]|nr:MAG: FAD-binding protein [Spirochaetales bacterium]
MDADCVIVGAGPAGLAAAVTARHLGLDNVVVLERCRLPRDKICAGGLTPKTVKVLTGLGLATLLQREAHMITGLRVTASSDFQFVITPTEPSFVLPRFYLDRELADRASALGVRLIDGSSAQPVMDDMGGVTGVTAAGELYRAPIIIAADGTHRLFSSRKAERSLLHGCMARFKGPVANPGFVEMIFTPAVKPHYCWVFPESENMINIGLCVARADQGETGIRQLWAEVLSTSLAGRVEGMEQCGPLLFHPLITSPRVRHDALPGVFLAGEACGLVNQFTGEGISSALISGGLAAETSVQGLRDGLTYKETERLYLAALKHALNPGLILGSILTRTAAVIMNSRFLRSCFRRAKLSVAQYLTRL